MRTSSPLNTPASAVCLRNDAGVIGLVGLAHLISHFGQLLLAPLFLWLKDEFQVSYAELGFLMTIFFVVSCAVQALSGFVVDRFGPRPVLFAGLSLLGVAAIWLFDQHQLLDDGRVYGVVYAGLDIGQAIAPLIFGTLMDHQQYQAVWLGLGLVMVMVVLIASAFKVRRVRRTALAPSA